MVNDIRNNRSESRQEQNPHVPRYLEEANDIESNPGPRSPKKGLGNKEARKSSRSISSQRKTDSIMVSDQEERSSVSTASTDRDDEKLSRLEAEIVILQETLEKVDTNVIRLQESVDQLRPIYNDAKVALGSVSVQQQKNNLIFYGIEPDPLEMDMSAEPDFCRDILETRVKGILKEHLKISRDISFVQVARINTASNVTGPKPIVACFVNWKDKENILRQAKLLKGVGITITEDISSKAPAIGGGAQRKTTKINSVDSGEENNREDKRFGSGYNSSSTSGTE